MLDTAMSRASMLLYVMVLPWTLGVAIFLCYALEGLSFVHPVNLLVTLLHPVLTLYLPVTLAWLWMSATAYEECVRNFARFRSSWMIYWYRERYLESARGLEALCAEAREFYDETVREGRRRRAELEADAHVPWKDPSHPAYQRLPSRRSPKFLGRYGIFGTYDAARDAWTMPPVRTVYVAMVVGVTLPMIVCYLRCPFLLPAGLVPVLQFAMPFVGVGLEMFLGVVRSTLFVVLAYLF